MKSFFGLSYAEDFNKRQKDVETLKASKALKTEILSNSSNLIKSSTGIKLLKGERFKLSSLHKKRSFPLRIFLMENFIFCAVAVL